MMERKEGILSRMRATPLYSIGDDGNVLFRLNLNSKVLSNIESVDYFENGDTQFLFNTFDALHLVDVKGDYVGNYPISLPDTARYELSFVDHSTLREPLIFIPCGDRIYSYGLNGRRSGRFQIPGKFKYSSVFNNPFSLQKKKSFDL